MDTILNLGALFVLLFLYFIPTFSACMRLHNNIAPIFVVNLVFGWTFLGWMVALIWSLTDNTE